MNEKIWKALKKEQIKRSGEQESGWRLGMDNGRCTAAVCMECTAKRKNEKGLVLFLIMGQRVNGEWLKALIINGWANKGNLRRSG